MSLNVTCPTCHNRFGVPEEHAGKTVKCPGCTSVLKIPNRPASVAPAATAVSTGAEQRPKKKKKKATKSAGSSKAGLYLVIGGGVAVFLAVVTLAIIYVPFGNLFSAKEIEAVDAYTAINGLSYHSAGERALQSKLTALAIPGRKKIIVTRANPEGGYLKMKLKIPYSDVEKYFPGSYAASRPFLTPGAIFLDADGQQYQPVFAHEDNEAGHGFQLDYSPRSENARSLEEYLGPSKQFNWASEGDLERGEDGMIFRGKRGLVARIRVGSQRQDGNPGTNPFNDLTGHKIFHDQDGLVPGPGGYIHVSWNENSGGWIVSDEIEMPNEVGRYWTVTAFFPRPKSHGQEATLNVLNVPRKVKLP